MLIYGESFKSSNEQALEILKKRMGEDAFRVALEMAPPTETDEDEEEGPESPSE